jgi:hypothetical protein
VHGDDERDAVGELRQDAAEMAVPGVAVDDVGGDRLGDEREAAAERRNPRTRSEPSATSWSPNVRTSTSISLASSRVRYSTWTPAPPYTFGGNSLVRISACIGTSLAPETFEDP